VSGSVILILNPSPQTKSTDDYAAGHIDADKARANRLPQIRSMSVIAFHEKAGRSQVG
jgi:hypothetical protein